MRHIDAVTSIKTIKIVHSVNRAKNKKYRSRGVYQLFSTVIIHTKSKTKIYLNFKAISNIFSIKLLPMRREEEDLRSKEIQSTKSLHTRSEQQPKIFSCTLQHYHYQRNKYSDHDSIIFKSKKYMFRYSIL